MLLTMRQGSAAMMDGFPHELCPRIVGGCLKSAKRGVVDLEGVRTRQPTMGGEDHRDKDGEWTETE